MLHFSDETEPFESFNPCIPVLRLILQRLVLGTAGSSQNAMALADVELSTSWPTFLKLGQNSYCRLVFIESCLNVANFLYN